MSTTPRTRGILFVHGVGSQRQSDMLLNVGDPLLAWLTAWYAARGEPAPQIEHAQLAFATSDDGVIPPSHTIVTLHTGDRWVLTEAWWAASVRRERFSMMVGWTIGHLGQAAAALLVSVWQRFAGDERDAASVPWLIGKALALYTLATFFVFVVGALIGLPLVVLLLVLAQLPIPTVQTFLLRALQPFLEVNIGEFRTVLDDEIQAANIRRLVAGAVDFLVAAECADVVIVAHSEGAVVSFDMLTDSAYDQTAAHVRKLITAGAGLNKAWAFRKALARLHDPLPDHIHWVDFWGSFDPVPTGWLRPPRVAKRWMTIFAPSPTVVDAQGLVARADPSPFRPLRRPRAGTLHPQYWPESVKVTNELSVLADHGGYWHNDEEVLARIAAETDCTYYRQSPFWAGKTHPHYPTAKERQEPRFAAPTETTIRQCVRDRRMRVIFLAVLRALFILLWFAWIVRDVDRVDAWIGRHSNALPVPGWLSTLLTAAVHLPALAWPLRAQGAIASRLCGGDNLLRCVVAAIVLGVPVFVAFLGVRWLWSRWNDRLQARAIARIATAQS
ncbi:MAG: hypothetical protein ACYDAR_10875 [Thermomicrobiales bacterium]